jgi:hypothetical protein
MLTDNLYWVIVRRAHCSSVPLQMWVLVRRKKKGAHELSTFEKINGVYPCTNHTLHQHSMSTQTWSDSFWHPLHTYCHVYQWIRREYGLVNRFIGYSQLVTTNNCNALKITVIITNVKSHNKCSLAGFQFFINCELPVAMSYRQVTLNCFCYIGNLDIK